MSNVEIERFHGNYMVNAKYEASEVQRDYIIVAPDKLKLEGGTSPLVLVRNGDEYSLVGHNVHDGSDLFTKEEAEKALKELGLDWELMFLIMTVKE